MKTSENQTFSDVFRGYRNGALVSNGLILYKVRTLSSNNGRALSPKTIFAKVLYRRCFTGGMTKIGGLSEEDMTNARSLALIELTALFNAHEIPMNRKKSFSKLKFKGT